MNIFLYANTKQTFNLMIFNLFANFMPLAYVRSKHWYLPASTGRLRIDNRCQSYCFISTAWDALLQDSSGIPDLVCKVSRKRIAEWRLNAQGIGSHDSLSLHGTKSYLLKRLRTTPDTTGGREYGGQSVSRGVFRCERKP